MSDNFDWAKELGKIANKKDLSDNDVKEFFGVLPKEKYNEFEDSAAWMRRKYPGLFLPEGKK